MKSIKILSRKVENGRLMYSAIITSDEDNSEEIKGNFNSYFLTNDVEIKIVDNIIFFHIQHPEAYEKITTDMGIEDFSKLKRMSGDLDKTFVMNSAFQNYFKRIMGIAKKIDNTGLLKPITKTSKSGAIQFMPCWMYLCGIKKANVNYLQSDLGLKSSEYEKEKAKELAIKTVIRTMTAKPTTESTKKMTTESTKKMTEKSVKMPSKTKVSPVSVKKTKKKETVSVPA